MSGAVTITTLRRRPRHPQRARPFGVTPVTITDQQPGDTNFTLELAGSSPHGRGKIEAEKTLILMQISGAEDRIVPPSELDERLCQDQTVKPELGYEAIRVGGLRRISMVSPDGTPKDIKVVSINGCGGRHPMPWRPVAQWRFKPGTVKACRSRLGWP